MQLPLWSPPWKLRPSEQQVKLSPPPKSGMEPHPLVRLRLLFDDQYVLSKSQRSSGLRQSWILLRPGLQTVSDVVSYIIDSFDLRIDSLLLSMDGFVLPPFESTHIFKDKDVVRVDKMASKNRKLITKQDDTNFTEDTYIIDKQPLLLCDKILPDMNIEKISHGFQSDSDDQPEEPIDSVDNEPRSASLKGKGKRKRKHTDDHQTSKRKKSNARRPKKISNSLETTENMQMENIETESAKKSKPKKKKRSSNVNEVTEPDGNGIIKIKVASAPIDGRNNLTQEGLEDDVKKPSNDDGSKKLPSRSARRKKAKRQWLRKQIDSKKKEVVLDHLPENDNGQKSSDYEAVVQNADSDSRFIPIVVRPGHIRFEPIVDEEPTGNHKHVQATLKWNGTINKKKGQKWGLEKNFTCDMGGKSNFHEQYDEECNSIEQSAVGASLESKRLVPLTRSPEVGDVFVYQLLELSLSWCPEISSDRVGKVTSFDPFSMSVVLMPVPGHPIAIDKPDEECTDEPVPSLYNDDGSLEIDLKTLINVRVYVNSKNDDAVASHSKKETAYKRASGNKVASNSNGELNDVMKDVATPSSEIMEVITQSNPVWDEVNQALIQKKAELTAKEKSSNMPSLIYRALRRSAIGPTISLLRAHNDL